MEKLTIKEGVAKRLEQVSPMPKYYLIVFRIVNKGEVYEETLSPGESFRPGPLRRLKEFSAIAVSDHPNWRLSFSKRTKTDVGANYFILNFELLYRVSNHRQVAETLDADPLSKIQNEIESVLSRAAGGLAWDTIVNKPREIGKTILDEPYLEGSVEVSNLEHLEQFAADYGIEIKSIGVSRTLQSGDTKLDEAKKAAQIKIEMSEINADVKVAEAEQDARVKARQVEIDRRINLSERQGDFMTSIFNDLEGIRQRISAGVNTIPGLKDATAGVFEIIDQIKIGMRNLGYDGGNDARASIGGAQFKALEAGKPAPEYTRLEVLLTDLFFLFKSQDMTSSDGRRLISSAFHLAAECFLEDQADKDQAKIYLNNLREATISAEQSLTSEQEHLIGKLLEWGSKIVKAREA